MLSNGVKIPPIRHQGIRHLIQDLVTPGVYKYEIAWQNGLVDWKQEATGSCAKYSSWTGGDWHFNDASIYTAYVQGDVSQGMKSGKH